MRCSAIYLKYTNTVFPGFQCGTTMTNGIHGPTSTTCSTSPTSYDSSFQAIQYDKRNSRVVVTTEPYEAVMGLKA